MSQVIRSLTPSKPPEGLSEDQLEIWDFMEGLKLTLLRKNADYGSSVFQSPLVAPHVSITDAILVRISDKLKRLIHLSSHAELVKEETIHDTAMDASAYFALLCIAMAKQGCVPAAKQEVPPKAKIDTRKSIETAKDLRGTVIRRDAWVIALEHFWNGSKDKCIEGKVLDIVVDPYSHPTEPVEYVQVSKYLIPANKVMVSAAPPQ